MEDSCSRDILSSIENVNIERVRPKQPAEDLSVYVWHDPQQVLEERRKLTEQRRDELLHTIYEEGLSTEEAEKLVREWIVLVVERDRLFREQLDQENGQDKHSYLRDLRQLLRTHPSFGDNSEEVNIRDALLHLEAHVTNYCTKHNITSPVNCPQTSNPGFSESEVKGQSPTMDDVVTPKPAQPVALDHQTGQSGIPGILQPTTQHVFTEETDCTPKLTSPLPRPLTPHPPPVPTKPQNLRKKFIKASPQRSKQTTTPGNKVPTEDSPMKSLSPAKAVTVVQCGPTPVVDTLTVSSDCPKDGASELGSGQSDVECGQLGPSCQNSATETSEDHPSPDPQLTPLPPPPPPLPPLLSSAMGTMQFIGSRQDTLAIPVNQPLSNELTNEPQDPSLELPSSEDRNFNLLMNEISSVGQTILRRTNRDRSPGGTPVKVKKNRLTLTGNTDMLQRALISKFRNLHSTPIKKTGDKTDSMEASTAWSDINGSIAFEDPDITASESGCLGVSNSCSGLQPDGNTSTAV